MPRGRPPPAPGASPEIVSDADGENFMFLKILFVACFLFGPSAVLAAGPGTTSANFLKIPVGARQTALGSAFTAVADDVNAIYYNPAGLAQLERPEVTFVHSKYFEDISQQWLAGALPSKAGVFGLGINYLSVPGFDAYDNSDNRTGSVSAYDLAANFSYANRHTLNNAVFGSILYGANLKYLTERLDTENASGLGLDIGILLKSKIKNLDAAFAADNAVSSKVKFIDDGFRLPLKFKTGLAYTIPYPKKHRTLLAVDWNFPKDNASYAAAGMETVLHDRIALRAGYNSAGEISRGFSLGFGLKISVHNGREIEVDYSWGNTYEFGNIQKMGILYRFGGAPPHPQIAEVKPQAAPKAAAYKEPGKKTGAKASIVTTPPAKPGVRQVKTEK